MHVTHWLKSNYSNIKTYKTNPSDPNFKIKAMNFASDNDVVLVNNYWGISQCLIETGNKNIITIEDHSHGWLSTACINSKADYGIASLRKSLPIPLGGIVWSPKNHNIYKHINLIKSNAYQTVWHKILKAMILKKDFENTGDITTKNESLLLINETELALHTNYDLTVLDEAHEQTINEYILINYLAFKSKNLTTLCSYLKTNSHFEIINPNSDATFGLIIHLKDGMCLEELRRYLISHTIYPSLLWPDNNTDYGYYLNIHIDYRYTSNDMQYIAETLNNFNKVN
jgi:hypothetical protein